MLERPVVSLQIDAGLRGHAVLVAIVVGRLGSFNVSSLLLGRLGENHANLKDFQTGP